MPDPAVEIMQVLKGASELMERVASEPHCLRCLELEAQVEDLEAEVKELDAILDEIAGLFNEGDSSATE